VPVDPALSRTIFAPVISALITLAVLLVLLRSRRLPMDKPNERSLHASPIPRIGGLAIVPAAACGWALLPGFIDPVIWAPLLLLFVVSAIDDHADLPAGIRFGVHLACASLAAFGLIYPHTGVIAALIGCLAVGWMTNLFNFMDGSDGLAGGMALFGFSTYALAAAIGQQTTFASICVIPAASAAAFLLFNFHPARVFLGDAGSIPLGFLAAALGVRGIVDGVWPAWFPVLVFSPFIVDASVTLLRRLLGGEKIWRAHRDHYYQRLVRSGWSHARVALAAYALMAVCGALGLYAIGLREYVQWTIVLLVAFGYLAAMLRIDRMWRSFAERG
jgi:UDP-N-acetylmuramyl pentapeptide phosphotransferase/UDP-N-acetylglucosamine-1-phosphate transferase